MVSIDSISNLDEHNFQFFPFITHSVCGALPLGKYFMGSKVSKTVIINTKITVLECSRSLLARSVPRSRATISG